VQWRRGYALCGCVMRGAAKEMLPHNQGLQSKTQKGGKQRGGMEVGGKGLCAALPPPGMCVGEGLLAVCFLFTKEKEIESPPPLPTHNKLCITYRACGLVVLLVASTARLLTKSSSRKRIILRSITSGSFS